MDAEKHCVLCGARFSKEPPGKPDMLKFVNVCWTCSQRIKRAAEEQERRERCASNA